MLPYTFIFANNLIAVTKHTFRRNLQDFDLRSEINLCRFHFAKLFRSSNGYNRHSKKCRTEENTFMIYNIQAVLKTPNPTNVSIFLLQTTLLCTTFHLHAIFFLTILQTPASPADSFGQRCHSALPESRTATWQVSTPPPRKSGRYLRNDRRYCCWLRASGWSAVPSRPHHPGN